jgi:glyoxylase-like metal-dependent hydrolase (beta-lactamase superfamily II)
VKVNIQFNINFDLRVLGEVMYTQTHFSFKPGKFECIAINDGSHDYELKQFFVNVSEERVVTALRQRQLPTEHVTTPYTCLYINTGTHQVLIDIGAPQIALLPNAGKLLQNFTAADLSPNAIDTIIVTHAHLDHIGGNLKDDGSLNFPNAHYYIWKDEWDFWTSPTAAETAPEMFVSLARTQLEPV